MDKKSIMKSSRGFTLIELLVVIAIIGILSSVILASLSTARQKARDGKRIAQIVQTQRALELYFDAYQSYPSTTPSGYSGDDAALGLLEALNLLPPVPIPPPGTNATYIYHGVYKDPSGGNSECDNTQPAGTVCLGYEFGMSLERADNTVLTNDADQNIGAFYGSFPDCKVNASGPEQCYDVSP